MAKYTTTAEIKRLLGISSTGDDTLIGEIITDAEKFIDQRTGRTFGTVGSAIAATARNFTVGVDTRGLVLYLDDDLASISAVKTNNDASTPVTVASSGYVTNPRNIGPYNEIKLLSDTNTDYTWDYTNNPENGIEITGVWQFSSEPPADIVRATKSLVTQWYREREQNEPAGVISDGVMQVISSYTKRIR